MLELGPIRLEAVQEVVTFKTRALAECRTVLEEHLGSLSVALIHLVRDLF